MAEPAAPRRTFVPVVLVGITSAALTAVVGHHPWAHASGRAVTGVSQLSGAAEAGRVPGCTALALVLLACWGVVLVTRGIVRVVLTWLALVAAIAAVVAAVLGFGSAPGDVRQIYAQFGITDIDVSRSAWSYLAFPVLLVAAVAAVAAVALVRTWPEMGVKYDTPTGEVGGAPTESATLDLGGEDQDDVRVWRALSEGRDPTT